MRNSGEQGDAVVINVNQVSTKRDVPLGFRLEVLTGQGGSVLFWVMLTILLIIIRSSNTDMSLFWLLSKFSGRLKTITGAVMLVTDTGYRPGRHNEGLPVFRVDYTFTSKDGKQQHGIAYCDGPSESNIHQRLQYPGEKESIEYQQDRPLHSSTITDGTLVGANLARGIAFCLTHAIGLSILTWYIVWLSTGGLTS